MVSVFGFLALVNVFATFWRSWAGLTFLDRLQIGIIIIAIAAICSFCLKHVLELDKLAGQVNDKTLTRLSRYASAMGVLGCLIVSGAMQLLHHY